MKKQYLSVLKAIGDDLELASEEMKAFILVYDYIDALSEKDFQEIVMESGGHAGCSAEDVDL